MNPLDYVFAATMLALGVFFFWCAIDIRRHPGRWS